MFFNRERIKMYKKDDFIYVDVPKCFNDGISSLQYHFKINEFKGKINKNYITCGTDEFKRAYPLEDIEFDEYVKLLYSINKLKDFNHI